MIAMFVCPMCRGNLQQQEDSLSCTNCDKIYPIRNGIHFMTASSDTFYYNFKSAPQNMMTEFLNEIDLLGWEEAYVRFVHRTVHERKKRQKESKLRNFVRHVMVGSTESIVQNVKDAKKIAWKFLLNTRSYPRVLDLGCGWGMASLHFAENSLFSQEQCEVVAYERTVERLLTLAKRIEEKKICNVTLVNGGDSAIIPFQDEYFDLIIINGVLEWIPSGFSGNARKVQLEFLKEVCRILKPDGQVYLAIENRYSIRDLLGFPEGHTGLPYVGILPRKIADIYSKLVKGYPLRVYTHSKNALSSLVRNAGLNFPYFYSPVPFYQRFNQIVDLERNDRLKFNFGQIIPQRTLHNFGRFFNTSWNQTLIKKTVPAFSVIISKHEKYEPFYNKFVDDIYEKAHVEYYLVRNDRVYLFISTDQDKMLAKLALNKNGEQVIRQEEEAILRLHSLSMDSKIKNLFPEIKNSGVYLNVPYTIQSWKNGTSADAYIKSPQYKLLLERTADIVAKIHNSSEHTFRIDRAWFDNYVAKKIDFLSRFLGINDEGAKSLLGDVKRFLENILFNQVYTLAVIHGDYKLGNILVNGQGDISAVVDLETSRVDFPILDYINLLSNRYRIMNSYSFGKAYAEFVLPRQFPANERKILEEKIAYYHLDDIKLDAISLCYWINHLYSHRDTALIFSPRWLNNNYYSAMKSVSLLVRGSH